MDYTVEVYKSDKRSKTGERLVTKVDKTHHSLSLLEFACDDMYPASKGFRVVINETYVTRKNLLTGIEFQEHYDTPSFCSPSSESFWAN
jgi:hypothetical protein